MNKPPQFWHGRDRHYAKVKALKASKISQLTTLIYGREDKDLDKRTLEKAIGVSRPTLLKYLKEIYAQTKCSCCGQYLPPTNKTSPPSK